MGLTEGGTSYIIQTCSSSVSLTSSLAIISMILCSPDKLHTPYRRLVFGLSMSDIVQSASLLFGPFLTPKDSPVAAWGVGNTTTCTINGFLVIWGSTSFALYIMLLCIYSFCKMNLKMPDQRFHKLIEAKAHVFILAYVLSVCITGVITESYNPLGGGGTCHLTRYPTFCAIMPQKVGECTRGFRAIKVWLASVLCTVISFIVVMTLMALIIRHALWTERVFRSNNNLNAVATGERCQWSSCLFSCGCSRHSYEQAVNESEADYFIRLHRRETVIQTLLYALSFAFSYIGLVLTFLTYVFDVQVPKILLIVARSGFYPLAGFLNIIIYTRPKIIKLRLQMSERISWLRAFILVVKAGGEVPDPASNDFALSLCCKCWYSRIYFDGVSELSSPPQYGASLGHRSEKGSERLNNHRIKWPLSFPSRKPASSQTESADGLRNVSRNEDDAETNGLTE